jgi:hypothetical protein
MIPSSPNERLAAVARDDAVSRGSDLCGSRECARRRPQRRKVCCKRSNWISRAYRPLRRGHARGLARADKCRQFAHRCSQRPSRHLRAPPHHVPSADIGRAVIICCAHPPSVRCPNAQCEPGTPSLLMAPVISIGLLPVRLLAMARSYLGRSARRRCGRTHELRSRLGQEIIICDLRSARPSLCHRNRQRGQVGASKRPSEGGSA